MPGPPPTPIEVKRKRGTLRGDRLPSSAPLHPVPALDAAPSDLPPIGTIEDVLDHAGAWLAATDALAVALLREAIEERQMLREAVMLGHGSRKELRELDRQIVAQLTALGLDPTSRARLGLAEVKAASTLDKLKASKAGKGA